ncbi:SulP family inorganic anion transporter [Cellulomonas composti]|uniref:SulP family inorganic anion transporter n=2 Tax=Cellulomonas composti TaxID=266130 RepID=A0A511JA32_9CELL|nr:SulP family inorganic anion transporter [Cellulomonas composti]
MRGYRASWLGPDLIAGATLAAVAIPEVMGYTSIAGTPIVTGLYTILVPTALFALLGSSRLLVVGGDSATAAILGAGVAGVGIVGLQPGSSEWLALCSLTAVVAGLLLVVARLFRLGFLGDFLSASVLIGFLTGVGVQVAGGQVPEILGTDKDEGGWFAQQWHWMTHLADVHPATLAYGLATIVLIVGFERFLPRVPGAIVAVVGLLVVATITDASSHGVDVVGSIAGGLPPLGLPSGLEWSDVGKVFAMALGCAVIILAQSAATSRSYAMKRGDRADIDRDLVGLAAANLGAGLTGAFVVNGSPTKTAIVDRQRGRSQVANLVVVAITLVVLLFFTDLLAELPKSVLGGIVLVIGIGLVDVTGLRRLISRRRGEFWIALVTALTVVGIGVGAGIGVAVFLSIADVIRRQYGTRGFVVGLRDDGSHVYQDAEPGAQSRPGLIIYRYDSELFFANASRFVDDVESVVTHAPDPVRWLVLDASGIGDVDYSAGLALVGLIEFVEARGIHFAIARADPSLVETLTRYELWQRLPADSIYDHFSGAVTAFEASD